MTGLGGDAHWVSTQSDWLCEACGFCNCPECGPCRCEEQSWPEQRDDVQAAYENGEMPG